MVKEVRARVSVTGTFFLHGAVFSSWYARLPVIQERLDLSPGQLGIALFGAPAGLLVAQPAVGALAARIGSRPIVAAAPLLAALGVIAFCALLAEGAVFDWSGIYLVTQVGATAGVAPLGLAGFSLFMGVGRLAGDRAAARAGSPATARGGALIAALGLGVALVSAAPAAAVAGFALMGVGLSVVFPLTLRASALGGPAAAAPSVAAVSTVGYAGLLVGPPVIGLLAEVTDLRGALALACLLCAAAAALTTHHAPWSGRELNRVYFAALGKRGSII